MRLELDGEGKLYIRDITDDAWDYITKVRRIAGDPWEWYFSKTPYNGSVRVYYNPYNFADDKLMGYLEELTNFYGLQCSAAGKLLLQSWRAICETKRDFVEVNREKRNLEDNVQHIRKILSRGCSHCANFREEQYGDDSIGCCCVQGDVRIPLSTTPLCLEHGGFGTDGMWHLGQKYYPHSGCKYLEIKGEKV